MEAGRLQFQDRQFVNAIADEGGRQRPDADPDGARVEPANAAGDRDLDDGDDHERRQQRMQDEAGPAERLQGIADADAAAERDQAVVVHQADRQHGDDQRARRRITAQDPKRKYGYRKMRDRVQRKQQCRHVRAPAVGSVETKPLTPSAPARSAAGRPGRRNRARP